MESLGKAKRVRIYVNADERAGGRPLHLAVLELLRREHARGATVVKGFEGFGATGQLHVSTLVDVPWHLPVIIEWVDRAEQVERLAPRLLELVRHGLVTVDDTELLLFAPPAAGPAAAGGPAATDAYAGGEPAARGDRWRAWRRRWLGRA